MAGIWFTRTWHSDDLSWEDICVFLKKTGRLTAQSQASPPEKWPEQKQQHSEDQVILPISPGPEPGR